MASELLTEVEFEAMAHLGKAAGAIRRVIDQNPNGQEEHDWAEAAAKIHELQAMVMAQAASRAYPDRFRPLGGWPKTAASVQETPAEATDGE